MLALSLGCRVLLVVLLTASVQTADKSQLLISDAMWSQGCVLNCARGRHRAVCGSNGRLYKSLCAFQRAQCLNTQLRSVPRTHCIEHSQSKCQLARNQALESSSRSDASAVFVPECTAEGTFLQVQCHSQTGYCWCSTADGKPVSGTSVLHQKPNCTGQFSDAQLKPKMESAPREEEGKMTPTAEPAAAPPLHTAEITAPPFWVTILMNSDPKGNRSTKQPTDTLLSCEQERVALLAQVHPLWREDRFVPDCSADGQYSPVQCHRATGYCWCVRTDTGRPLPGTSTRNKLPDCRTDRPLESQPDRSYTDRPLPGCPGARKKEFLQRLVHVLQLLVSQAGGILGPHGMADFPAAGSKSPSPAPAEPDPSGPGRPEGALRWHFLRLDADGSGVLSEREARPLRLFLRSRLRPRRCAKKFSRYCDRNGDRGLTLAELTACLGL
ncbi:SPARC-related modular calcium-binding protein 1-like [Anguilla anguilla]|uniref:SPARC-related modular calcium-binding protein 1-like n=1 Tax=Anguilla anguilla TaxID=7936 RepID=UPI0015AA9B22|nr:SPARC-related modular calcium-binding protein 1-like [Anguilla anguilla]XP_035240077.1 SPARC-related modular calcium-binding protein 1-like [Anguilla anguilla]